MTTERSLDLMDELAELAAQLDRLAPSVQAAELRGLVAPQPLRDRRRLVIELVAAAAVAAVVIGGLVLVTGRDGRAPVTVPSVIEPSTPPETTPPETVAPTTIAPTLPRPSVDDQLAAIEATIVPELAALTGFHATATISLGGTDANGEPVTSTSTNEVTLLGNGSMWATLGIGGWGSFDPATGITRGAFGDGQGGTTYQLIEGWTDNSVGLNILLGHDPVLMPTSIHGVTAVAEVQHDGRPAWSITATETGMQDSIDATYVIDQATGLLVAHQRGDQSSSLTGLTVDAVLPPEFPGTFPDGVDVQRSGDPNGFQPMPIEEAVARFGSGAMTLDPIDPATTVSVSETPASYDGGYSTVQTTLVMQVHTGFLRSEVTVFKNVVTAGAPPAGTQAIVVDGMECASVDGVNCADVVGPNVATDGPLAGYAIDDSGNGSASASNGPIQVWIAAPSAEAARALLDALRPVPPQSG